jgi:hypothetical protein
MQTPKIKSIAHVKEIRTKSLSHTSLQDYRCGILPWTWSNTRNMMQSTKIKSIAHVEKEIRTKSLSHTSLQDYGCGILSGV